MLRNIQNIQRVLRASVAIAFSGVLVFSQTTPSIKQEAKNASCSNIVALAGNATVNCSSLTPRQQKIIESIPSVLNEILTNQLDPDKVMAKLDEIEKGIEQIRAQTPRRYPPLPDATKKALVTRLSGRHSTVSADTRNPSPDVLDFATTLLNIFHDARWNTAGPDVLTAPPDVGDEGIIPIPKGLHVRARSECYELALFVQQQLKVVADIDSYAEKDERVSNCNLELFVGAPE